MTITTKPCAVCGSTQFVIECPMDRCRWWTCRPTFKDCQDVHIERDHARS